MSEGAAPSPAARALGELDELLVRVEALPGAAGELALEAIAALCEVYGAALTRITAMAADGSGVTARQLADDDLIEQLLLLHGLHPDPTTERVERVVAEVGVALDGADVRCTGITDGVARIEIAATGCSSQTPALLSTVSDAVLSAAPELAAVEPVAVRPSAAPALIPADTLLRRPAALR